MPLSWNEIRQRSITFAREWADASRERAESQTFWNEFFKVFGKSRRAVASFEEPVKNLKGDTNFIDLLWPGRVIAEHKSKGKDLAKAETQAIGYIHSLINEDREDEAPRYIIVSDFARIALHDLEEKDPAKATIDFPLKSLHKHIRRFAFIAGYETQKLDPEDPANLKATSLLANLHDRLEDGGYTDHNLQRFMVRVLFCLFAEDTGIFEPNAFEQYILNHTAKDGSDLGLHLARLFEVLNKEETKRQQNLNEDLAAFPYVNGDLFAEQLAFADFDSPMRTALLECCRFKWEAISPAVFGSLFQSIKDDRERRQIGAHYTSERDILKLIRSLFLDDLRDRFNKIKTKKNELKKFIRHLGSLRFLDPACGCGNFLILAYRELRRLEMDALEALYGKEPDEQDLRAGAHMEVDQFYGIEIEEWPALIAEVGMWLMDHQMNCELFARFGTARPTTPLTKSPTIRCANALRINWNEVLPADQCSYIMGNPPFVGSKYQTSEQRQEVRDVWGDIRGVGTLDYVSAWYARSCDYISQRRTPRAALVSTNSITQGEQVGTVWNELLRRGMKIDGGHRTFPWESEARGKAHVHVVIVGFGFSEPTYPKRIHDYGTKGEPLGTTEVANISPYLTNGSDKATTNRNKPLSDVPSIGIGNKPIDDGNYLFTPKEKAEFLSQEPLAEPYFRQWYGSREFINGIERWCLWLGDIEPDILRQMPHAVRRVEKVKQFRLASKSKPTNKIAETPTRFHVTNTPCNDFLVIPKVSSERRDYIPIGFMIPETLASDLLFVVPDATRYHFGILHSAMHMSWVRQVCGRLESRYRYSAKLVYNNYPWPESPTASQKSAVEKAAQSVLDARENHPSATLADLYDPLTMPADLAKAHTQLDRAVDRCYRPQPFPDERRRFEYLFEMYEKLTAPLTAPKKKTKRKNKT